MHEQGQTLHAVQKTIQIIECLSEHDEARVNEIAQAINLPASTVHSHLSTLKQEDMVAKEGDFYHLGMDFLKFGNQVQYRKRAYRLAEKYLDSLVDETGCRATFLIEEHGYGVFVHGRSGKHTTWKHARDGEKEYLHILAVGKAILAHLPESRVEAIIDRHGLIERTENSITSRQPLYEELADISDQGVAYNHCENVDSIVAIGAPIINSSGQVIGGISLSGAANRLTEDRLTGELKTSLLGAIDEFELELALS